MSNRKTWSGQKRLILRRADLFLRFWGRGRGPVVVAKQLRASGGIFLNFPGKR